jgi:colicin import membrane protein
MSKLLHDQLNQNDAARAERALGGEASRPSAPHRAGELDAYLNAIRAKVRGKLIEPPGLHGNPEAIFEVTQLPSGEVLAVRLVQSSGTPSFDTAVERAIRSASPLPLPTDGALFDRDLQIKYRLRD